MKLGYTPYVIHDLSYESPGILSCCFKERALRPFCNILGDTTLITTEEFLNGPGKYYALTPSNTLSSIETLAWGAAA